MHARVPRPHLAALSLTVKKLGLLDSANKTTCDGEAFS